MHALKLDQVILMVANAPWQKEGSRAITPVQDRFAMVEAAVAAVPGLVAGDTEIHMGGPSYTVDTLRSLRLQNSEYVNATFFTIVGDDAAAGVPTWERFQELTELTRLVVVDRPGAPVVLSTDIDWIRVEVPRLDVSSTDLRSRFTDGRPLDYLITQPVLGVIRERSLYSLPIGAQA